MSSRYTLITADIDCKEHCSTSKPDSDYLGSQEFNIEHEFQEQPTLLIRKQLTEPQPWADQLVPLSKTIQQIE